MRKEKLEELKSYIGELKTIQIVNRQVINKGFLSINQAECRLNNGKTIKREQILKNGKDGSAVIVLPITKDRSTILVVQPRPFLINSVGIELPAGYIEQDETPLQTAMRELEEETGYVSKKIKLLGSYYQDQGCSAAMNYSFLALDCEQKSKQHLDRDEYIRYFECTYEEALELVDMGYINAMNSVITLEKSKPLLKRRKVYDQ